MRLFIKRFLLVLLFFMILVTVCLLLMMKHIGKWDEIVLVDIQKREQVALLDSPKMLFIGGSNLSYGIDSQLLQDSLHINVYNMGIHAGIGLNYMLKEALQYVQKNDVLVIVPEYNQFTDYYGSAALANLLIQTKRWSEIFMYRSWDTFPSYFCSKVYIPFLLKEITKNSTKDIYADNPDGFNLKGDYVKHLDQPRRVVARLLLQQEPSDKMMDAFVSQINVLKQEGYKVILLPPCYQQSCYDISKPNIEKIVAGIKERGLSFDAPTERYCLNDTLFWNTAYHLSKQGRDVRTRLVIDDISEIIKNKIR